VQFENVLEIERVFLDVAGDAVIAWVRAAVGIDGELLT